jgi:uncharacterized protein YecT (DUF1311 family)
MEDSMMRVMLALAMLLLGLAAAQAASFDCGKAGTPFEMAICANPDASKADEVLAQAYATALGGLSKPAADSLKATQHDWLNYAARACSDDAQPIAGTYNGDQQQCLVSTIRERIAALEASRMLGGYRFYPWERYLVIRDPDATADSYNKVATRHYQTIKMDGSDDVASAFNAMTETMRQRDDALLGEDAHLFTSDGKELDATDASADIDISTTVESVSAYRITLETDNYWFGHGAAHGNYGATYDHFLIEEARALAPSDIFAKAGWEAALGKLVVDRAKEQLGEDYQGTDADVAGMAADPGRWEFSADGLVINFNPYDVAAYAVGAVSVMVPWNDITDLLAEHAMEIATY